MSRTRIFCATGRLVDAGSSRDAGAMAMIARLASGLGVAAAIIAGSAMPAGSQARSDAPSDWTVSADATGTTYRLTGDNSRLSIECVSQHHGGGAVLSMVVDGRDPAPRTISSVIVGERIFGVRHDFAGVGVTDCPSCAADFDALWAALRDPATDEITLKSGEKRRHLRSRGGETALGACQSDFARLSLQADRL
ncbi:hypothetical protein U0C82_08935 [Fulvimarina sp. 2208YS6-2-32]|uniref:Lipoprotein n=1 Tax=Fulvimarina uroteuthidis TaxID=3098149 RepID=A0ABU5I1P2_9HYPH|nr:hypothetical protein [Fulvimarina sp. 2208YS6-2-32]MDY8109267.1 hypothetical protein [Fulvimarina sp. 2208YS6-2-32]